jgi:hypothetical protein
MIAAFVPTESLAGDLVIAVILRVEDEDVGSPGLFSRPPQDAGVEYRHLRQMRVP